MTPNGHVGELARHLAERAATYYPDFAGHDVAVRHERSEARASAHVHRFALHAGGRVHRVLIKEPRIGESLRTEEAVPQRPRLFPRAEPKVRFTAEYQSLKLIESRLAGRDSRFSFIRALDFIEPWSAIVMELSPAEPLRNLIARHTALHRRKTPSDLADAFVVAGAWLRAYHALEVATARDARTTRSQLIDFARSVSEYLAQTTPDGSFIRDASETAINALERTLPERLPVATAHGDYAPRNLLFDGAGRIAVIDTSSRWTVCRLEDAAYFLMSLRLPRVQALSQHRVYSASSLNFWEATFLRAYWRDDIDLPVRAVFAYQLILLLDLWAARLAAQRHRGLETAEALLLRRSYRWEAERLMCLI